ncbi:hypothetical protein GUJ93_ZPchr0008g12477 [Zizania palustris]|uniref:WRKY domain-containing protein n=1 Tax=Zizania palustris TaxID=103762 RepID=A0A8J5RXU8_ZIZPA|nr:hypothetical protein GUJ93_ZPchr0008g12477 [Zizania palustris]
MEGVAVQGNGGGRSMKVVAELGRVLELVRQLEMHMHAASQSSSSVELCRGLVAQIIALTDRSIGMVMSSSAAAAAVAHFADAPPALLSGTPSPLSDVSDQTFRTNPKKRKTTARWTSHERVSATGGTEGPVDDGHSWRKYGQKDILGAKHPRGYYRCTHRNSQGCTATKQVQRTDDDPSVFDVVYHGEHTCRPAAIPAAKRPHAQTLLQSLSAGLTVSTDNNFLTTAVSTVPRTPENRQAAAQSVSPPLASPVASDSYGLVPSPCPVTAGYRDWPYTGDLQEVVSALTTAPAEPEPAIDPDFMPYYFEFDPTFGMDQAILFP